MKEPDAVVAPADASEDDIAALSGAIESLVKSAAWKEALSTRGWLNLYQPGAEFGERFPGRRRLDGGVLDRVHFLIEPGQSGS